MRRNTDIIKNIKRVSCRFDMDVPEERRAWQTEKINEVALDFMDRLMGE